jgi:hypothetical protein
MNRILRPFEINERPGAIKLEGNETNHIYLSPNLPPKRHRLSPRREGLILNQ